MDMNRRSTFLGMTRLEAATLVIAAGILAAILGPALSRLDGNDGLPRRAICSANIRGIIQAMVVYAQSYHGCYPSVKPAGTTFVNGLDPRGAPTATRTLNSKTDSLVAGKAAGNAAATLTGSPLACLWLLVTTQEASPEAFICPADPAANRPSALYASTSGDSARCYLNFGMNTKRPLPFGQGESYSMAYPWVAGAPAPWWNANLNQNYLSNTPLVCDMAPMQDPHAPGKDARDVTQPLDNKIGPYIFNSGNHGGDGQNVGYCDDHVAFNTNPYAGVDQDNIFTSGQPGTHGGGTPIAPYIIAPSPRISTKYPFDIVMVPTRNVHTGRW